MQRKYDRKLLKRIQAEGLTGYQHCHWRTCIMHECCIDQVSFFRGPLHIVIRIRVLLGGAFQVADFGTVEDVKANEEDFLKYMGAEGLPLQEVDYDDAKTFFNYSMQLAVEAGCGLPDTQDFELIDAMYSHEYSIVKRFPSAKICPDIMDLFTVISYDQNLILGIIMELRIIYRLETTELIDRNLFQKAMDIILTMKKKVLLSLEFSFYWCTTAKQVMIAGWIHNEIIGLMDLQDQSFKESIAVALMINRLSIRAIDPSISKEDLYLGLAEFKDFTGQSVLPRSNNESKIDFKALRKSCAYCKTFDSKNWERCGRCRAATYCCFDHLKNDWKNHAKECSIDMPRFMLLAKVRKVSKKSVDQLCQGLKDIISSKDYPLAIRILTKAIDKLVVKSLSKTDIKYDLLSLCAQRAYCNLEMAILTKSVQLAQAVVEDYIDFYEAIRGDNLDDAVETVKLFESYRDKAYSFIDSQKVLEFLPDTVLNSPKVSPRNSPRNSPRMKKKAPKVKSEISTGKYELVDCKLMGMHGSLNIECSICRVPYAVFPDPSFAINLICNHSTCAVCLTRMYNICAKSDQELSFACPLCRERIDLDKFRNLLNNTAPRVKSFVFFTSLLPMTGVNELIGSLLLTYEFDIIKVDCALFNIASLQPPEGSSVDLSYNEKREIYKQARKPILALEEEFREIQERLESIFDHNSIEWKETIKELREKIQQLEKARMNASSDIFERMNSTGNLGILIDEDKVSNSMGHFKVDLHGLHPSEAIDKITDIVLPVINVMHYVEIVTGKGKHSTSGSSILFKAVTDFLKTIPHIEIRIPKGNTGMINVRYKA